VIAESLRNAGLKQLYAVFCTDLKSHALCVSKFREVGLLDNASSERWSVSEARSEHVSEPASQDVQFMCGTTEDVCAKYDVGDLY
jgi:hypothetical protein